MKEIHQATTEAMQSTTKSRGSKYPWNELEVGQCFNVSVDEMKKSTLIPFAYRMGKKHGKRFRVIDWGEHGFEVARLPDKESAVNKEADKAETTQPLTIMEALSREMK